MQTFVHVVLTAALAAAAAPQASMGRSAVMSKPSAKGKVRKLRSAKRKLPSTGKPLTRAEKATVLRAVAKDAGLAGLTVKKVYTASAFQVSDGLDFETKAILSRTRAEVGTPSVQVAPKSAVRIGVPTKVGGVYLFDCGVATDAEKFEFKISDSGLSTGTVRPANGRILIAHATTATSASRLSFSFRPDRSFSFLFSGCEITETAPLQRPRVNKGPAALR